MPLAGHVSVNNMVKRFLRRKHGRRPLRLLDLLPARTGRAPVRARELGVCEADRRTAEADEAAAAALGAIAPAVTVRCSVRSTCAKSNTLMWLLQ